MAGHLNGAIGTSRPYSASKGMKEMGNLGVAGEKAGPENNTHTLPY